MGVRDFYQKHHYKLFWIPIILILISLISLGIGYLTNGEIIQRDVSLKGGISANLITNQNIDIKELEEFLSSKLDAEVSVRSLVDFTTREQSGLIIETSSLESNRLEEALKDKIAFEDDKISIEEVGPSLGVAFFKQMITALLVAFLLMAIVVFVMFRSVAPSLAVVLAAFGDMIVTLAILRLIGFELSITSIAGFLLVIGYSIDTDMLLTSRVLKRRGEGSIMDRIFGAFKTGITMTLTTLVALIVAYFITNSSVLKGIFTIIIVALIVDLFMTWLMNTSILIMYCKKKGIL